MMTDYGTLIDITEDTLLVIVENLLLDKQSLLALQRTCIFFAKFFNTYSIWRKHDSAIEGAWMSKRHVESQDVVIASTNSEKESQLNNSEHMEVLFMDVCDKYIVLVRYNQLNIVCSCPDIDCQCDLEQQETFEQKNTVPKRLEIWDHEFKIIKVISSKTFGLNSSKTLGGAEQFKFWSSMKREYPLYSYNKQRKIFAWIGSQIQDIQIYFHFIEENSSQSITIGNNQECFRAYAVAMFNDKFAIAFEKKYGAEKFELLVRWYQYESLDQFTEILVFSATTSIGKYSFNNCSPLDMNDSFTVIINETLPGVPESKVSFKISSVTNQNTMLTKNTQFYIPHSRIFMKMNENNNLVALIDSSVDFGELSVVRLFNAQDLEEVLILNLRNYNIGKTALTESSNRVFWFQNILVVVSDEDILEEEDFVSGRRLTFFTLDSCNGQLVSKSREVNFWNAFVNKQTSTEPKLALLGREKEKGLFMEAVAVGNMGVVVAARLHCDYNEDVEDMDEASFLFYMNMLGSS